MTEEYDKTYLVDTPKVSTLDVSTLAVNTLVVGDTEETTTSVDDESATTEEGVEESLESEAIIRQEVLVTTTDPIKFAELLLEWGAKGARLKDKTYVYLRRMPLQAHLVVEVGEESILTTDANSKVSPVGSYLKPEQFEELSWAEVVQLGKKLGLKYGKRDEMTAEYFAYVEKEHGIVFK